MQPFIIDDLLSQVESKTLEVLRTPEKKDQWLAQLEAIRQTVAGDPQFQLLIENIIRLVEGDLSDSLKPQLEEPFSTSWTKIVAALASFPAPSTPEARLRRLLDTLNKTLDPSQRLPLLTEALRRVTRSHDPWLWAQLHLSLGQGLAELPIGDRRQHLEDAIAAYGHALQVMMRDASPESWAYVRMCLGNALEMRLDGDKAQNIEDAIAAYHDALEVYTREAHPGEWAQTNMNLSIALYNRQTGDPAENIEQAITTLADVGGFITPEVAPREWINLMSNTANAYLKRVKGDRGQNVELAVSNLRHALSIIPPQHAPALWVTVAINLAWAESERTLGDRLKNLEEAQRTLLAAERLCDARTAPADWLRLCLNLNEVLQKTISLLRHDAATLAAAIKETCRRIWNLYGQTGESVAVLDNAVRTFALAVEFTPADSPDLPLYLVRLGIFLEDKAKLDKDVAGLDRAIEVYEKAVQSTPPGTQQLPRNLNSISLAFFLRHEWSGHLEDLRKSVEKSWLAVELSSSFPLDKLIYLGNLRKPLEGLYAATKDSVDLERIGRCYSEILTLTTDKEDQIESYGQLAYYRMRRYARSKESADLDQAIEDYEKAVALVDEPGVRHSLFLAASTARHARFELKHAQSDLETAARQLDEADRRAPDDAPEKSAILNNGGAVQVRLYELTKDLACLDKAIHSLTRIPTLKLRAGAVNKIYAQLADLHQRRYDVTHECAELRSVIKYESQYLPAVRRRPADHEHWLIKICRDYARLFDRIESVSEIERAIAHGRSLVGAAKKAEVTLAGRCLLVDFLLKHYHLTAQKEDLDDALEQAKEAGRLCSDSSELFLTVQAQTAGILRFLYEKTNEDDYRRQSAQILDGVRKRVDAGDAADAFIYTTLGHDLLDRFAAQGQLTDLESSLEYHTKAIAVYPNEPKSPGFYTNLGNVLSDLYSATGTLQFLHQAIDAWSDAVRLSTADSPYHSTRLTNLGSGWLLLYRHTHSPKALDSAIELTHASIDITDAAAVNLPVNLFYLGQALLVRYDQARQNEDLVEAVAVLQRGLALTTAGSNAFPQLIALLGQALRLQSEANSDEELLAQSIETLSHTVQSLPPTSRFHPELLAVLGANFQALYEFDKRAETRRLSEQAYRRACQSGIPHRLEIVLSCSQQWGDLAAVHDEWPAAAEAYGYGIGALAKLYQAQVLRSEKETWLADAQRLHSKAAFAMARAGRPQQAVEVIEAGRARLLVEVIERQRTELQRLPQLGYADAFNAYSRAADRLAYLERKELQPKESDYDPDSWSEISSAQQQLDQAVQAIRRVPGYEFVFAAPSFQQISQIRTSLQSFTARPAIVLYLLVAAPGGLAILLAEDRLDPIEFPLNEADLDALMLPSEAGKADGYLSIQFAAHPSQAVIDRVLESVGKKMMVAVAAHLPPSAVETDDLRPTLVLVPAGRLALLPLHAVPCGGDQSSWTLLDRYEVTFIPSLRSLNHCLERARLVANSASTLSAVANPLPTPAGFAPLTFARPEVEEIATGFAGPNTLLCEDNADLARLDALLDAANYLHFSCHGLFDPNDPMLSGISLSGGQLFTLRDLVSRPALQHARLAVLSACQTAITEFNLLPEEAIGLPSGFLQAGLPGVVGSLWPVQEISTALLMIQLYTYLLHGEAARKIPPQPPMQALRLAQLWLRNLTNARLADIFDGYRKSGAQKQTGLTPQLAQLQFQRHALSPPNQRPYSNPYYWAAFAYFGV